VEHAGDCASDRDASDRDRVTRDRFCRQAERRLPGKASRRAAADSAAVTRGVREIAARSNSELLARVLAAANAVGSSGIGQGAGERAPQGEAVLTILRAS
jgi:hypothetical protein